MKQPISSSSSIPLMKLRRCFFSGGRAQRASGKSEIRQVFAELFKQRSGPITITPRDVNVQLFGDVAIVTAHLRALPTSPVREPTVFPRRTFVLRRVGGGRWLIVQHAYKRRVAPCRNTCHLELAEWPATVSGSSNQPWFPRRSHGS